MKTFISNFKTIALLTATAVTLGLTSCDKDDDVKLPVKATIVGTWDIDSYKVAGDEYMGLAIEAASLTFDAYVDEEGVFEEEVTFPDEESVSLAGAYTVNEAARKIVMNYEGELVIAEVEFSNNGNTLHWDGSQDGYPLVIKATRRQ
jgi:hypothetical protein